MHADDTTAAGPRARELVASLEMLLANPPNLSEEAADATPRDSDEGVAVGHALTVIQRLHQAFPDAAWRIGAVMAENDLILCHADVTGTHAGTYAGIPATTQRVTMHAVFVARRSLSGESPAYASDWWCALDDSPVRMRDDQPEGDASTDSASAVAASSESDPPAAHAAE